MNKSKNANIYMTLYVYGYPCNRCQSESIHEYYLYMNRRENENQKPKNCPDLCSNRHSNAKMGKFAFSAEIFLFAENYKFDICISSER